MVQQTLVRILPGDSRLALVTIQDVTSEYEQLKALQHERAQLARLHARLQQQNEQLADLATTDELTGVKNRRRFREDFELHVALAVRQQLPLSLVMLDVDHFKQYNDTFGHPAGDEALRNVAQVLREGIRKHDIVARYGGEEFVMLLPATDSAAAPGGSRAPSRCSRAALGIGTCFDRQSRGRHCRRRVSRRRHARGTSRPGALLRQAVGAESRVPFSRVCAPGSHRYRPSNFRLRIEFLVAASDSPNGNVCGSPGAWLALLAD